MSRPERATAGAVTADGRLRKYGHGQHACYVLDCCRCEPCRAANRAYERQRRGSPEPAYVSAQPAREHVLFLRSAGVGMKTVAATAGVPHGSMSKLLYGDPRRGMGPSKRIRRATSEKILGVMPSAAKPGSLQPAGSTWRLIDEMVAAGVPKVAVARYLGQTGGGLQLSRRMVHQETVVRVKEMYARWLSHDLVLTGRGHRHVRVPVRVMPPVKVVEFPDRSQILVGLVEVLESRLGEGWRSDAACRNRPTYLWFPARGDSVTAAKALQICRSCLVRQTCLDANVGERDGIFGGLTGKQRRALRRDLAGVQVDVRCAS